MLNKENNSGEPKKERRMPDPKKLARIREALADPEKMIRMAQNSGKTVEEVREMYNDILEKVDPL